MIKRFKIVEQCIYTKPGANKALIVRALKKMLGRKYEVFASKRGVCVRGDLNDSFIRREIIEEVRGGTAR